jgi:hypothetical protein
MVIHPDQFPAVNITFVREHGVHQFELSGGGLVTTISQPSWERFATALSRVDNPGDFILSPELITVSPEPSPGEMAGMPDVVEQRTEQVRTVSQRMPETTIVLGSLAFDTPRPRNTLLFVRDGEMTGRSPKLPYLAAESAVFHQAYDPAEHQRPAPQTDAIICSDILFHRDRGQYQEGLPDRDLVAEYIDTIGNARTLLVSSLWISPYIPGIKPEHEEARFVNPLRYAAGSFFYHHPSLQDIVMADQLPAGTPASGPVNFNARRA